MKILKLFKRKYLHVNMSDFSHFSRILDHCAKSRKYAKYEGLFFCKILVGIGVQGQNSLSGKNIILE